MIIRFLTSVWMGLFSFMYPFPLTAEEKVTIAVLDNYPPYMFGVSGFPNGMYVGILNEVFTEMEVPVSLEVLPWKRIIRNIDKSISGGAGLYFTKERAQKYDFSKPIYSKRLAIYVKAGSALKIRTIEDLKGLKVGTVFGWSYTGIVKDAMENGMFIDQRAISERYNIRKLITGQIDVMIAIVASAEYNARKLSALDQIRKEMDLFTEDVYIAFNKKARRKGFLNRFNAAYKKIKQTGKIDQILVRYDLMR